MGLVGAFADVPPTASAVQPHRQDPSYMNHDRYIDVHVSLCAARHLSRFVPRDRHRPLLNLLCLFLAKLLFT